MIGFSWVSRSGKATSLGPSCGGLWHFDEVVPSRSYSIDSSHYFRAVLPYDWPDSIGAEDDQEKHAKGVRPGNWLWDRFSASYQLVANSERVYLTQSVSGPPPNSAR